MNLIVVVDKNWGIGKNNGLLFSLKKDMKFFRETTTGKVVVMGANTFLSFPNGALPNRVNVVSAGRLRHRRRLGVCAACRLLLYGVRQQGGGGRRGAAVFPQPRPKGKLDAAKRLGANFRRGTYAYLLRLPQRKGKAAGRKINAAPKAPAFGVFFDGISAKVFCGSKYSLGSLAQLLKQPRAPDSRAKERAFG